MGTSGPIRESLSFTFTRLCSRALGCACPFRGSSENSLPKSTSPQPNYTPTVILWGYFGQPPSVDIFLHFFEVKKQGKSPWASLRGIAGRAILSLFQQSYKGWKGKFFKVCCSEYDQAALDDFPLYWVEEVKLTKPKSLDELPLADREICQVLGSVSGFDTSILISREHDAEGLTRYISIATTPFLTCSCLPCFCLFFAV